MYSYLTHSLLQGSILRSVSTKGCMSVSLTEPLVVFGEINPGTILRNLKRIGNAKRLIFWQVNDNSAAKLSSSKHRRKPAFSGQDGG